MPTFRDLLVAVVGLTPQVITETMYYLTRVRQPPAALAEIHVLTTQEGKQRLVAQLLPPRGTQFEAFCADYDLDAKTIRFRLHLFRDTAGVPLDDIRTAADSEAVAGQITTCIRHLSSDPSTRLFCSIAGGRKTQSVLLGFALQLYGRPQDTLLHVLVDEVFQNHPDFFYPPPLPRRLETRDGHLLDAHSASIEVAEIPFLRLRDRLGLAAGQSPAGFGPIIADTQEALDALPNLPRLVITSATRGIRIGEIDISLPPLAFAFYSQLAWLRVHRTRNDGGDGFVTFDELDDLRDALLQRYAGLYGAYSGHVAALRKRWTNGLSPENIRSLFASIRSKFRQALPDPTLAAFYEIASEGPYGKTRYGLRLWPQNIEFRDP